MRVRELRVLIADDEAPARERLIDLLAAQPHVALVAACNSGPECVSAIAASTPDVVYLDVQMPGCSGLDVARQLGPAPHPLIVFATAYDQYAIQAFETHAIDYLLKPFSDERFLDSLQRARRVVEGAQSRDFESRLRALLRDWPAAPVVATRRADAGDRITVRHDGRILVIPLKSVEWFEVDGEFLVLHRDGDSLRTRGTMVSLRRRLSLESFVQVHRSVIANIHLVAQAIADDRNHLTLVMRSGARLGASRRFRQAVLDRLDAFIT